MFRSAIKLRHLVCWVEVARQGRFASAAEALLISQPGMSKTIREREASLAETLFERGPRGVKLTPAGRTLLRHSAPALRSIGKGNESNIFRPTANVTAGKPGGNITLRRTA